MKQIERRELMDIPCDHLKAGRCNIKQDVKFILGGDATGGSPCIRWDEYGRLKKGVRFDDCPSFKILTKDYNLPKTHGVWRR